MSPFKKIVLSTTGAFRLGLAHGPGSLFFVFRVHDIPVNPCAKAGGGAAVCQLRRAFFSIRVDNPIYLGKFSKCFRAQPLGLYLLVIHTHNNRWIWLHLCTSAPLPDFFRSLPRQVQPGKLRDVSRHRQHLRSSDVGMSMGLDHASLA